MGLVMNIITIGSLIIIISIRGKNVVCVWDSDVCVDAEWKLWALRCDDLWQTNDDESTCEAAKPHDASYIMQPSRLRNVYARTCFKCGRKRISSILCLFALGFVSHMLCPLFPFSQILIRQWDVSEFPWSTSEEKVQSASKVSNKCMDLNSNLLI